MFQISVGARCMPLFVLIGVLVSSTLFAQKSVHLAGKVYDKTGPLEYVTITLSKWSDTSKVQQMATSDSLGSFTFEKIVSGEYQVKYSLIGYLSFPKK
ncbi:MAG: carboxypeptidase regulatory-like domain-containing protein [Chitinophagaceae bacterium]|nr:carboxypeptidase regulatory-like domain-containing protein [Chitinophagaceae bacterium]